MKVNKIVNVLVAELERKKNLSENVEVEARDLKEKVDRLKGNEEDVRKKLVLCQSIGLKEVEVGMV